MRPIGARGKIGLVSAAGLLQSSEMDENGSGDDARRTAANDGLAPGAAESSMRIDRPARTKSPRHAIVLSLALHVALLAVAVLLIQPQTIRKTPERRVDVEMIDTREFEVAFAPPAPVLPQPAMAVPSGPPNIPAPDLPRPDAPASLRAPRPAVPAGLALREDGMFVAKRFLSAKALDDPRSADAKAALPMMHSDERLLQLCNIEALEQVAALDDTFRPDLIVSYAMDDVRVGAAAAKAPGAAVRNGGHWFNLAFECTVTPDLEQVAAFAFRLGDEIPEEDWESHNLVSGGDLDKH